MNENKTENRLLRKHLLRFYTRAFSWMFVYQRQNCISYFGLFVHVCQIYIFQHICIYIYVYHLRYVWVFNIWHCYVILCFSKRWHTLLESMMVRCTWTVSFVKLTVLVIFRTKNEGLLTNKFNNNQGKKDKDSKFPLLLLSSQTG